MFSIAAIFAIFACVLLWAAYDCHGIMEYRKAALSIAGSAALVVLCVGTLVLGSRHPEWMQGPDRGHGAGWTCLNLGRGGADVCLKDRPSP